MKSILAKILLWCFATLLVCLAGSYITNSHRNRFAPGRQDFFSRSISFQLNEATSAYEKGGASALANYFRRLQNYFPGHRKLVNAQGIDLVSGADLSAQLHDIQPPHRWSPSDQPRMIFAWPSHDGRYRLVIDAPTPPGPWSPVPYLLWLVVATTLFGTILALHLASPLKTLRSVVERFGRGDLSVRSSLKRRDEFGKLGDAFNQMATRIETLLTAERRLLQDVSHELRSPLARLEFAIELARSSPDRNVSLDRIKKEAGRLSNLVSELLQVTRAENDPASRNLTQVFLPALLEDLVNDSQIEAQGRQCEIQLTVQQKLTVTGDRELLRRAFENVLRNSIRYAPARTTIWVETSMRAGRALISIRDFGPGVPEAVLTDIFHPFFRVHPDRSRANGGVGLGLSIAQRAIDLHGGSIIASNAAPGLRVEIELSHLEQIQPGDHTNDTTFDPQSSTVDS